MYKISTKYKLPFLPRFVKKVVMNAAGLFAANHEVSIYTGSAGEICHSDVIYLAHACASSCTEK